MAAPGPSGSASVYHSLSPSGSPVPSMLSSLSPSNSSSPCAGPAGAWVGSWWTAGAGAGMEATGAGAGAGAGAGFGIGAGTGLGAGAALTAAGLGAGLAAFFGAALFFGAAFFAGLTAFFAAFLTGFFAGALRASFFFAGLAAFFTALRAGFFAAFLAALRAGLRADFLAMEELLAELRRSILEGKRAELQADPIRNMRYSGAGPGICHNLAPMHALLLLPATQSMIGASWQHAGPVSRTVMVALLLLSVISWGLVIERWWTIRHARTAGAHFAQAVIAHPDYAAAAAEVARLPDGVFRRIFLEGYNDLKGQLDESLNSGSDAKTVRMSAAPKLLSEEALQRAFARAIDREITALERGLAWLATTASAAPFIGLFGTVWGVMDAFGAIGQSGSASLAQVAPGISEALLATAIGLIAAIPALMAFNLLSRSLKVTRREMEFFASQAVGLAVRKYGEKVV